VNLVQGDNWVVYHLWNRKLHRFEMSVLDLFEPQMNWKETTFSARTAPLPQVCHLLSPRRRQVRGGPA
jgi:hypothetical protein